MRQLLFVCLAMGCDSLPAYHPDLAVSDDDLGMQPDQAVASVAFTNMITIPTDVAQMVYPDSWMAAPADIDLVDPYCTLQAPTTSFPATFVGALPLPPIAGAPLPAGIMRDVALKDYWDGWVTNATLNQGCSGDLHTATSASMARLKKLGADRTWIQKVFQVVDMNAMPLTFTNRPDPDDAGFAFNAMAAIQNGIELGIWIQMTNVDSKGQALLQSPTSAWFGALLDAYAPMLVAAAQLAEKNHVKAMTLNFGAYSPADMNNTYLDVKIPKLTSVLQQVRAVFSGKVYLIDTFWYVPDLTPAMPLINSTDGLVNEIPANVLTADENTNLDFALLKSKYQAWFKTLAQRYAGMTVPLVLGPEFESLRDFFYSGWIEDGFCVNNCSQANATTDFSVQAMGYEAFFEALADYGKSDGGATLPVSEVVPITSYWFTDELLPKDSFPNISESIRDKPAEKIIEQWYAR